MIKQYLTYREFLNEGLSSSRKAFLTTGKIGPEDFERLTLLDTTPTKKYLDSICRFYLEGHSEEEIKTYVDKFHTLGSNLPKKDINLYSFDELKSSLDNYNSKNQKDKKVTKDINVVYEDERFFIVRPDTFEQSAKYGRGTKWCIAATDGTGQEAWDGYYIKKLYTFYFITDKSLPSTDPFYKVAIAVDINGQITLGDSSTVDSLSEEIDGEEYIEYNGLPRELFVTREIPPLEKWNINLSKLKDGVYDNNYINIEIPKDIKEFRGFKEELGHDIKEIKGSLFFWYLNNLTLVSNLPEKITGMLSFNQSNSLTSVSNLPEYVGETLSFYGCKSLKAVSNLPKIIGGSLSFRNCKSLTSIEKMPSVVVGSIYTAECPFFEGMTEEQIREKYNITRGI